MTDSLPGEFELIARLTQSLPLRAGVVSGVGDDCAILDTGADMLLLATCDSQVEGVHFTFQISSPEEIGRKALAINISDIAAMGGEPLFALISLILPVRQSLDLLERFYAGLRQEAEQFTIAIVGGNISGAGKGEQLIIDITLLGSVERGHALVRSGARVGDVLFVTGSLGDSAAGLYTLLHPNHPYPPDVRDALRSIFRVPRPRVREGRILSQFGPEIVTAMLDISDGLSGDLQHLCERSHVGARVEADRLPRSPALRTIAGIVAHDPFDWSLHGGEDYELLFSVSPGKEHRVIEALQSATGTPVTAIGTLHPPEEGMKLVWPGGHDEMLVPRSWNHLRQPR
jgi:thiamine-monophosphate kinase